MTRNELGASGESKASEFLNSLGFDTFKPTQYHFGDICAIDRITGKVIYLEVKTVSTNRATIRKQGSQSLVYADFVLIYCNDETYLIPASKITGKRVYLSATSKYKDCII